jgi:hypothetical protein
MVASFLLHSVIVLLFVRHGVQWLRGGGGEVGPRGGGGGGSSAAVSYVQLPAVSGTEPVAVLAPPALSDVSLPVPEPVELDVRLPESPLAVTPAASPAPATGDAGSGGPGAGPGTGGGSGAGVGPGTGNDSGPGRGGDGEYISPPYARTVLLPADCARGRLTVRFWVEDDGRVARVALDPPPKNAGCRREMLDKMMGYQFLPARTRDGRAVASVYEVQLQH